MDPWYTHDFSESNVCDFNLVMTWISANNGGNHLVKISDGILKTAEGVHRGSLSNSTAT